MYKRFAGLLPDGPGLIVLCVCCLQISACTFTEQHPGQSINTAPPHAGPSTVQVTFETTEANRQRARAADQPVLLKGQAPVYPDELIGSSIGNGWVELLIAVSIDGTVGEIQVLASTHRVFESPAIVSVKNWQFESQTEQKSIRHRVFFKHEPADHYQPLSNDQ